MTVGLWLLRLLFWAITLTATLTTRTEAVGDFVDTATCYDGLAQADVNGDNRVELDEYLTFVKFIGPPGFFADIDSMLDAPLTLQGNFLTLACICRQNGGDKKCCDEKHAHIPIDGVIIPDPSTFPFLFFVCSLTSRSIDLLLEETSPTSISTSPTKSLAPSPMPSNSAVPTATATPPTTTTTTTPDPTQSPSPSPSAIPTPSPRPTTSPSAPPPSSSPSAIPTTSPRPTTSPFPPQPSSMPVGEAIGVLVRTIYTVVVVNGINENIPESSYVPDLIASMNVVAVEVASEVAFGSSNGSSRRRLEVRVSLPTFIDGVVDAGGFTDTLLGACPSNLANPDNDKCEQVTASVGLFLDDEAPQVARQLYQTALRRAIVQGRLQDALMEINPDSPVRIITGLSDGTNDSRSTEPGRLSAGAAAGIVIGAFAVVGFMVAIFIVRKREEKPAFDERPPFLSIPSGSSIAGWSNAWDSSRELKLQTLSEGEGDQGPAGSSRASISSAGQSDWPFMSTLSLDSCDEESADEEDPTNCGTIMVDLDSAIVAGDRTGDQATLGATTALLAANASGRWDGESSVSSRQSSASGAVLFDGANTAELHRLIKGGDWEGVMRAAKKFSSDAKSLDGSTLSHPGSRGSAPDVESLSHPSSASSSVEGSATGSTTGSGITPHTFQSSTLSAGTSKNRDRPKRRDWPSMLTSSLDDSGDQSVDELDPTNWDTMMVDLGTGSTELDSAIAAGDRGGDQVTVGAATALLDANASGRWDCESSFSSRQSSASDEGLLDEAKAAELHQLLDGGDWEGFIHALPTLSSDDIFLDGSILSHQDSRGSASGVESSHPSSTSSSIEGSATGSTTGSGILPHTFPSITLVTGTSKNRDRAKLRDRPSMPTSLLDSGDESADERWDRESSVSSRQSSVSGAVLLDELESPELHPLIDGGDWEVVIRVAPILSSDDNSLDGSILSHQDSQGSVSIEGSATGSRTGSGITPHTFPSITLVTGASENRDRAELRRQVGELLQQVVPEEMEHLDEMMLQFEGFEEELLETLKTMQERQMATRLKLEPTSELPE